MLSFSLRPVSSFRTVGVFFSRFRPYMKFIIQSRSSKRNSESNLSVWLSPNHGEDTQTQMVCHDMATSEDPLAWRRQFCSPGSVKGTRIRGRQKKKWEDNIKEWSGIDFGDSLRTVENRERWKGINATSSVVHRRPSMVKDWDELQY